MKSYLKKYKRDLIFFCPSIEEGGVEKNLINICNNLSNDFNISLLTANSNKKNLFKKKINFISPQSNFYNNKSRIFKLLICSFLFMKYSLNKKILIFSFQANIGAIILGLLTRSKVVIRSNTSPGIYANNFIKRTIMKFFYNLSDEIVVNSKEFKNEFKKYFNLESTNIFNLLEDTKILKKHSKSKLNFSFFDKFKNYLKIISVGRLVDQKDHLTILKAIKLNKKKKIKFLLIGKGELKTKLFEFIKKNQMLDKVKIIGFQKNIYPFYKKADLFILSSKYEGLPNVLLEAVRMGLPVFSSNCKTGPKEILKDYKYSKIFKVSDYNGLSLLIKKFKKKKIKQNFIDDRFDFNTNLTKYKNLILKHL